MVGGLEFSKPMLALLLVEAGAAAADVLAGVHGVLADGADQAAAVAGGHEACITEVEVCAVRGSGTVHVLLLIRNIPTCILRYLRCANTLTYPLFFVK